MRRLLLVSPHFPPDSSAGAHRARVVAPHLARAGWEPTVLTVDPAAYAGTLDDELAAMVPADLRVVRAPAWRASATRRLGFGDLGLRALPGLWRTARQLIAAERFDAVFVTTYPVYPALLGPRLRACAAAPLVVDLQDPWTGAWGVSVGGGNGGRPDLRSRLSHRILSLVERQVLPCCDAITGVSGELIAQLRERYPALRDKPALALPIGLDPGDIEWVRQRPGPPQWFDPHDGNFHVCYVGTLLPLAMEPLRAVLAGVAELGRTRPQLSARLKLHFIGTSNQADAQAQGRVAAIADEFGVRDQVTEHPGRIPFADALRAQLAASALLVLGSTERRYNASKLAPALAAARPLLVVARDESPITGQLRDAGDASIRVIRFGESLDGVASRVTVTLAEWLANEPPPPCSGSLVTPMTGPVLAQQLATLLDRVSVAYA